MNRRRRRELLEAAERVWWLTLIVLGVSAWIGSCLTGCASAPDALHAAHAANDAVVAAIERARAMLAEELERDARARAESCKQVAKEVRLDCRQQAVLMAYDRMQLRASRLSLLVLLQHGVAEALDTAAECRRAGTNCENEQVERAQEGLARVRGELTRMGVVP